MGTPEHPIEQRCRTPRAFVLPLALAFVLLGASSAFAITRDSVLERAQKRVDIPVAYSQAKRYDGYRTDCSGYVSMCWKTGTSWNTRSFHAVSHSIPVSALQPGDALLKKGYHVRLFYGWVDEARTKYVAYESADGLIAGCRIHSIAEDLDFGYVPVRYDRVSASPKPRNVLKNGSFDVWSRSWGSRSDQPVWWQSTGAWWKTLVTRRKDTYRSARSSADLVNPAGNPAAYAELSQSVPIVAGAQYRLSVWAKTSFDPRGLELKIAYLNAADESLAETSTSGDCARVTGTKFKKMSVLLEAPPGSTRAQVSVRLAGGRTTTASGTVVPGTSATLDDISLVRPQVTVGITTSAGTARRGKALTMKGAVTPSAAIEAPAIVYMQKPGSAWKKLSATHVYASDGAGAWSEEFRFAKNARSGTYRFKTTIPSVPGHLGATTSVVSVKLK